MKLGSFAHQSTLATSGGGEARNAGFGVAVGRGLGVLASSPACVACVGLLEPSMILMCTVRRAMGRFDCSWIGLERNQS